MEQTTPEIATTTTTSEAPNLAPVAPQDPPQEPPKVKRGEGAEAKRVAQRLNGFDYQNSEIYKILKQKFSSGVTHSELRSIAQVCCHFSKKLVLDRDAQRDNRVLIKWFEENWNILKDLVDQIKLRDENEEIINLQREHENNRPYPR